MQIYNEKITDLIPDDEEDDNNGRSNSPMIFGNRTNYNNTNNKQSLQVREDNKGIFVQGLKRIRVTSEEELFDLIKYGSRYRFTKGTSMNKTSSRSHAILQILVEQKYIENDNDQINPEKIVIK